MPEQAGGVNAYTCQTCGKQTITINRDDGTTPFMIVCRSVTCDGPAYSSFYRVPPGARPTHEWYRPDRDKLRAMDDATQQHVRLGGLILRRIRNATRERFGFGVRAG